MQRDSRNNAIAPAMFVDRPRNDKCKFKRDRKYGSGCQYQEQQEAESRVNPQKGLSRHDMHFQALSIEPHCHTDLPISFLEPVYNEPGMGLITTKIKVVASYLRHRFIMICTFPCGVSLMVTRRLLNLLPPPQV
jgi:hypothetical protein